MSEKIERLAVLNEDHVVYFEAITRQGPVSVPGFLLALEGYEWWFVVHRPLPQDSTEASWIVSEISTGRAAGFGQTVNAAVSALVNRIPPPKTFSKQIAEVLRDQPGLAS